MRATLLNSFFGSCKKGVSFGSDSLRVSLIKMHFTAPVTLGILIVRMYCWG